MGFLDSLDIANRALQHCGQPKILSVTEDTKANTEATFAYDKLRKVELRRNIWRFATRKVLLRAVDTGTMVLKPTLWNGNVTYNNNAIVSDVNNELWYSTQNGNLNNATGGNNELWEKYFGPLTIEPFDTTLTTAYWTGELVYMAGALSGSYVIYQSKINVNSDVPNVATVYDPTVQYNSTAVVSYTGSQWQSNLEVNLNNTPTSGLAATWNVTTIYSSGQLATGSDGFIYSSMGSGNVGNDPTLDLSNTFWMNTGAVNAWTQLPSYTPVSSTNWNVIAARMRAFTQGYPLGTGPSSESETRNIFRLPSGYLKTAPQDPKAGSTNYLGAPSGLQYEDWDLSGNFLVSSDTGPLLFRFIADVTKVRDMDDMFCEGLSLKVATGIAKSLTQSHEKLADLASEYKTVMGEARTANLIEVGAIEPPEDDIVTCRM